MTPLTWLLVGITYSLAVYLIVRLVAGGCEP
jgi:hypothetical protein